MQGRAAASQNVTATGARNKRLHLTCNAGADGSARRCIYEIMSASEKAGAQRHGTRMSGMQNDFGGLPVPPLHIDRNVAASP